MKNKRTVEINSFGKILQNTPCCPKNQSFGKYPSRNKNRPKYYQIFIANDHNQYFVKIRWCVHCVPNFKKIYQRSKAHTYCKYVQFWGPLKNLSGDQDRCSLYVTLSLTYHDFHLNSSIFLCKFDNNLGTTMIIKK